VRNDCAAGKARINGTISTSDLTGRLPLSCPCCPSVPVSLSLGRGTLGHWDKLVGGRTGNPSYGDFAKSPTRLERQTVLACQHAINPSLLVDARRVKRGERLGELPEPRLLADPFLDEEPLESNAADGGEQDHHLMDPVEDGRAGMRSLELRLPNDLGCARLLERREKVRRWILVSNRPRMKNRGSVTPVWPPAISDRFTLAISPANPHSRYDATSNREKYVAGTCVSQNVGNA
jgi:hypothetical protein